VNTFLCIGNTALIPMMIFSSAALIQSGKLFKCEMEEPLPEKKKNWLATVVVNNKNSSAAMKLYMLFLFIQQQANSNT
jgi:hypothetical protein